MDLVTPTWVTALRGIGVVCNIYNIAKASDDVVDDLEEKMGWIKKRRAKKQIKRHYNGRVAELNSECKDTIKLMKRGNSDWRDKLTISAPLDITAEDKSSLQREAAKAVVTLRSRIEYDNKTMLNLKKEIAEIQYTNPGLARKKAGTYIRSKNKKVDDEIKLATVNESLSILNRRKIGESNLDLSSVYNGLSAIIKDAGIVEEFRDHNNLENELYQLEETLTTERQMYELSETPEIHSSEIDNFLSECNLYSQTKQGEIAKATKKSSDLENLVSKARVIGA